MLQALDIRSAVAGFVVIGGRRAIHQVIHGADWPSVRAVFVEQVTGHADDALGQA
ncbi:hypothetical protein D3C87_1318640 [compost metagenome]